LVGVKTNPAALQPRNRTTAHHHGLGRAGATAPPIDVITPASLTVEDDSAGVVTGWRVAALTHRFWLRDLAGAACLTSAELTAGLTSRAGHAGLVTRDWTAHLVGPPPQIADMPGVHRGSGPSSRQHMYRRPANGRSEGTAL
jgi:hypothetical protein